MCVCVLCCSNTLRANVFVMRICYRSRFYAALIHRAAYRACRLISPANGETPVNTPDAHFPFSSFYSMCFWLKKNQPFSTVRFSLPVVSDDENASRPPQSKRATIICRLQTGDGPGTWTTDPGPPHQSAPSQTTLKGIT